MQMVSDRFIVELSIATETPDEPEHVRQAIMLAMAGTLPKQIEMVRSSAWRIFEAPKEI